MGFALYKEEPMRELQCGECGIRFAAPEFFMAEKKKTGQVWYCPNGHSRVYLESTETTLRRELEAEKQARAMEAASRRIAEDRQRKAELALKRVEKRVHAGVCTCCNRTFQNLARHMKSKHSNQK